VHLQEAMRIDPEFAMPAAFAARWACIYIGQGWAPDRAAMVEEARQLAVNAINLDRNNALGLAAYGHVKSYLEREYETALIFLDRAREVGPSQPLAWILSSGTLSYIGRPQEAIEHAMYGIRLSPNDPDLFQYYDFLAIAHYLNGDYDKAYAWSERSFAEKRDYTSNWRVMSFCAAAAGKLDRAKEFVDKMVALEPDFTIEKYMASVAPFREETDRRRIGEHMALAGFS